MDLSIIIVSYNTKILLGDCLQSIKVSDDKLQKEIIVVDNASTDDSVEMVVSKFPESKIIKNSQNRGFAAANNQGVKKAKGEYILLLNSDTKVKPTSLERLLQLARENNTHLASCRLLNPDGTLQPQGGFLPRLFNVAAWMLFLDDIPGANLFIKPYQQRYSAFFQKDQQMGWVAGTAFLVKQDVYQQLGGLNEKLFMYGEDVEFCLRANKKGIVCQYFHEPEIIHLGQGSGTSKNALLGEYRALKYIFTKHKPTWEMPILRALLKAGAFLRIILFGIILGDENKKDIYRSAYKLA